MKTGRIALYLMVLMTVFLVAACSSQPTSTPAAPSSNTQDGAALLQDRCTVCHNLSRVESKNLSSTEWVSIVDEMMGKGAKLSADEKALLVDYLTATYGK